MDPRLPHILNVNAEWFVPATAPLPSASSTGLNPAACPFIPSFSHTRPTTALAEREIQRPPLGNFLPEAQRVIKEEAQKLIKDNKLGEAEQYIKNIQSRYPQACTNIPLAAILAGAIYKQSAARAFEAELILMTAHPFFGPQRQISPSNYYNANLTISRIWQLQGKYSESQAILLMMGNQTRSRNGLPPLSEQKSIITPCGDHLIDLAMVRLQEEKGDYPQAETLLLAMMKQHRPRASLSVPCGRHDLDLAMVRLQQEKGDYPQAVILLLAMMKKHSSQANLSVPCGKHDLDLAMVRLQEEKGDYLKAETLLLAMMKKLNPQANLSVPCGKHDLDLVMVRLQEEKGDYLKAETLLLAMRENHNPQASQSVPCGKQDLDLAMVRLQEEKGDYLKAETLLLAMMKKLNPQASLSAPCGEHDLDLTMVRLQEEKGDYLKAETLLLAMRESHNPQASQSVPCGKHGLDLAMIRLQQGKGDYPQAKTLLLAMRKIHSPQASLSVPCGKHDLDLGLLQLLVRNQEYPAFDTLLRACQSVYPYKKEYEETYLISLGERKNWKSFDEEIKTVNTINSVAVQHIISVRFFQQAIELYNRNENGDACCLSALNVVEKAIGTYPPRSYLFSQKAHCLRMLGYEETVWRPLFQKADTLDPARMRHEKLDSWRKAEHQAFQKIASRNSVNDGATVPSTTGSNPLL